MKNNPTKYLIGGVIAASVAAIALLTDTTYYVSTAGSDQNTCVKSAPCKTITKGISVAQPGDTVIVLAGTYKENVNVNKPITLQADDSVLIDGTGLPVQNGGGLINIPATVSGATVQGFEVANGGTYGISVFGNSSKVIGNKIHHIYGVGIWMRNGRDNLFENNELYFSVLQNSVRFNGSYYVCNPNNTTGWPSAINPWGTANSNIWRGNYVHDNCGEGIVLYNGDVAENNVFENNWSVEIYIDQHTGVTVRNNHIDNSRTYFPRGADQSWKQVPYGIAIADEAGCLADRNTITGNTIINARYGFSFYTYAACSGLKNTIVENNTIVNAWEYALRVTTGSHVNSVIRNNTVRLTTGKPLTIQSNNGIVVTGNSFASNANVFEWNGATYNFLNWSAIVPGNIWVGAVTPVVSSVTPTRTVTLTALPSSTSTVTATQTAIPATVTRTSIPPTVTLAPATRTPTAIPTVCFLNYTPKFCVVPLP